MKCSCSANKLACIVFCGCYEKCCHNTLNLQDDVDDEDPDESEDEDSDDI
jgi:hypothetical protein